MRVVAEEFQQLRFLDVFEKTVKRVKLSLDFEVEQSFIWTSEVMLTCRTVPPDKNFSSNTIS